MKIAVDVGPISNKSESRHKVRGVGKYISLLSDNLPKFDKENSYSFFEDSKKISPEAKIVHYPYFDPFFLTLPFKNIKKTIVTVHDLIPLVHQKHFPVGIKGEIKWQINKQLLKRTDGIIVDSNASGEDVVNVAGIKKEKIFTVYLSCDEEFIPLKEERKKNDLIKKYDLPDKFFLYVGDVTWNKNLPFLLNTIEKVNIPLVMVGKALADLDFDDKNPWNTDRKIVNSKTQNNPLFKKLGFVSNEDLNGLYNLALALCMPSLDEGFGLPILEAMNSGCPVITSERGSLPEVGGNSVHYIDPKSLESLEDGLRKISNSEKMRNELSEKGLIQASKFTLKKMVEDTVSVYKKYQ